MRAWVHPCVCVRAVSGDLGLSSTPAGRPHAFRAVIIKLRILKSKKSKSGPSASDPSSARACECVRTRLCPVPRPPYDLAFVESGGKKGGTSRFQIETQARERRIDQGRGGGGGLPCAISRIAGWRRRRRIRFVVAALQRAGRSDWSRNLPRCC